MEEALAKNMAIRTPTMGALVDRIGHAYGLEGAHLEWARTPEAELGTRIASALPSVLERWNAEHPKVETKAMDDAFKAGSEGGPAAGGNGGAFSEDIVMGVPAKGPPKWIIALVGALILGGVVVFLLIK
jgi:hypothetical protein